MDKVKNRYSEETQKSVTFNSDLGSSNQECPEGIVFRPISRDKLSPSPVELAIKENRKIAFYIPSEEFQESALFVLNWAMERLHKKNPDLVTPEYEFVIGKEVANWDGKLDENGRVIISHVGAARFG